jgi:hypothetical protein
MNTNLNIDSYYKEFELRKMEMIPLDNHGLDYLIYEKDTRVYYFEKVDKNLLRFFCSTNRDSFYLS